MDLIPGNRYDTLPVAELGSLDPELSISVVIPAKDQPLLAEVVESLTDQTYPSELVEIIVVDDGSEAPLVVDDLSPEAGARTRVVAHSSEGFGAGAARRAGASVAAHDIVAFVDSDLRVPRHYLEAHARWHHVASNAVVIGQVRMLEHGEWTLPGLRGDAEVAWHPVRWVASYLERTDRLVNDHRDIWSVTTGASLSVRRHFHDRIGGFAGLGLRGVEDIEFGYRAYANGALFIPESEGFGWHPPERFFDDPVRAEAAKARRSEILADRIPTRKTRPARGRRIRSVPTCAVHLEVPVTDVVSTDQILSALDATLTLASPTTEFILHGADGRADSEVLVDAIAADPRARLAREVRPESALAYTVAFCALEDLRLALDLVGEVGHGDGLLGVTHADRSPTIAMAGRLWNRALEAFGESAGPWPRPETVKVASEAFGGTWIDDGRAIPRRRMTRPTTNGTGDEELVRRLVSLEAELEQLREAHRRLRSRRVVRLANRLGKLR